jgi:uncharacterized small protein (DUF1192 family)
MGLQMSSSEIEERRRKLLEEIERLKVEAKKLKEELEHGRG